MPTYTHCIYTFIHTYIQWKIVCVGMCIFNSAAEKSNNYSDHQYAHQERISLIYGVR
jgi:hypothetical protein